MKSKKLVWCCIAGIVLGFIAPVVFPFDRSTSLSVGLAAGLGIGYLLDIQDEKKQKQTDVEALSGKAREANRLMAQARAELDGESVPDPEEDDDIETGDNSETELSDEEQTAKLNEAEELLRKARERIK